ncbi:MAG: TIR domain-containing protein [Pseudanabaenaceae cyanobacterium bins.39]|nr:TIR domain-containing protein [Pseudanabaenaceae cyanobacterium bins.39]
MARSVFFSFHYQRDIWRVNVVRNHFLTKSGYTSAGYWDHSLWETVKRDGDLALKRMINKGLENTSVTVVLIGAETAQRKWVQYEIEKSYERGNGMLGIYIHNIPSINGFRDFQGRNPFDYFLVEQKNQYLYSVSNLVPSSNYYPTYDWVSDDGYNNFSTWVETAAKAVGR